MKKYVLLILLFVITCLPLLSIAQGFDDGADDVPIDGGLSLLVAAGMGYGARKLRQKKNKHTQDA